ncbi:MAG: PepSY domain-containing protein [Janthinobacterium lividum]
MKKTILSALALGLLAATTALAQTTPMSTSDGGDKTKQTVDGMTVKTKVDPKDGKMKVKGRDEQGNTMKAYTKPRKGELKADRAETKMDRKAMKMEKKGMKKDSTKM